MTVQRNVVVEQLAELKKSLLGDEDGLIPGFNVLGNQLPTSFWNTFASRLVEAASPEQKADVEKALINCAYECGYHTGYGIITSEEFKAVVMPMVTEGAKDVLRGAFAVFTAWGWAKSGIVQLQDGQRMVIRCQDYYEADGTKGALRAYMLRGICKAFMDLAYSAPYPDGMGGFECEQTLGIEAGAPYGEFVITKK
jgi:hypothetical protein